MNRWRLLGLVSLLVVVLGIGGCFLFPNHPPVASFTVAHGVNPNDANDQMVVVLDASASSDPDGDQITKYMWSFGGDMVDFIEPASYGSMTVSVPSITIRFPLQGEYDVTLVVVDSRGGMSEPVSQHISVPVPVSE